MPTRRRKSTCRSKEHRCLAHHRDFTFDSGSRNNIVHAIQRPQKGRFPAAGGPINASRCARNIERISCSPVRGHNKSQIRTVTLARRLRGQAASVCFSGTNLGAIIGISVDITLESELLPR